MKKVVIITINYNSEKETHGLLFSLGKIKKEDYHIVVVVIDNASKNPFNLTASELNNNVYVIRNEENMGFTGGNNIGIRYALESGADYILLINNDTFVDKDFIIELLKILESNEKIGAVVPKIYFAKGHEFHKDRYKNEELGKVFWYAGGYMDWANIVSIHRGVDEVDKSQYQKTEEVDFATGCCVLIKREVLEKVGAFNDKYFLYFEDADLSIRLIKAGYSIKYVPKAIIWHINASSSGSGSSLHDYFLTRNRMLFGMKFAPLRSKIALIKESMRLLFAGRPMQKKGIRDYYLRKFGKGSYFGK